MCGLAIHCETALTLWFDKGGITTFIDYLHRDAASRYMVNWFYRVTDVSSTLVITVKHEHLSLPYCGKQRYGYDQKAEVVVVAKNM